MINAMLDIQVSLTFFSLILHQINIMRVILLYSGIGSDSLSEVFRMCMLIKANLKHQVITENFMKTWMDRTDCRTNTNLRLTWEDI